MTTATLPMVMVVVATLTACGPASTAQMPPSPPPVETAAFPLSARYVETLEDAGRLLARNVYQFTGSSWDDFTTVLLSSSDEDGAVSQGQIGYVTRYRRGALVDGWIVGASNELEGLSLEQVNDLLEDFPGNAQSVQESTVPAGEQAPSPVFNRRWLTHEGLALPSEASTGGPAAGPLDAHEPGASTAAASDVAELHTALSNPDVALPEAAVAGLLDLPRHAVVSAAGGDGSSVRVESRKELVFALGSGIPLAGRVEVGSIVETLLVIELGPPAPMYARPSGSPSPFE